MNESPTTHLVVGAGATGAATARLLADQGDHVRLISRSGSGPVHTRIERIAADANDAARLSELARGAATITNCANPAYTEWHTVWPPLAASILAAAESSGAVLVTLSNLYAYAPPTRPMRATDPLDPPTDKGEIRAAMWRDALAAHEAGRIRAAEARASDFVGPGVGKNGHLGDRVVPKVLAGKSVSVLGDPDAPHSWTAIQDVARTLVALGADERAWGRAWHVPTAPPQSSREMIDRMAGLAGVEPVKVRSVPRIALAAASLVSADMREIRKVAYQFEQPFVIDAADTTAVFGIEPTPLDDTLQATIDSYRPSPAAAVA
jgi:nucleoside-diphosphate-sugar epimerase